MITQLIAEIERYAGIDPDEPKEEKLSKYGQFIGKTLDDAFVFSKENQLFLVNSYLESAVTKQVAEFKENLFALNSLPGVVYLSLVKEELAIRTAELKASPNWREVRTKGIDLLEDKLLHAALGNYYIAALASELTPKKQLFDAKWGQWVNYFVILVEEIGNYDKPLALSRYIDFLSEEIARERGVSTDTDKSIQHSDSLFDAYIIKDNEKVVAFMREKFDKRSPKRVVALLVALKELALIKPKVFDKQSELCRAIKHSFDYQGTRAAISQNIKLYNRSNDAEKSAVKQYKKLIINYLDK